MAYSDFDFTSAKKQFSLTEKIGTIFDSIEAVPLSQWLDQTLARSQQFGIFSESEKARSEFIVAPILLESLGGRDDVSLYSGKNLEVDKNQGLNGECDFILSKGKLSHTIQTPIMGLVEAKKNDIDLGLGQCVSQMVGAQRFNKTEETGISTVFGCITTGEVWLFLKLQDNALLINKERFYLNDIGKILGVFKQIFAFYD